MPNFHRSFSLYVGLRYLFSKKKKSILSITTFISLSGITIGVMALIVVISVMNGFGYDLQSKVLGFKSHIVIESKDFSPFELEPSDLMRIRNMDSSIKTALPTISTEMMARFDGSVSGVLFKGIQSKLIQPFEKDRSRIPPILVGRELAYGLGATVGDVIEIISPIETTGPLGTIPKMKKYRIASLLETGLYEFDTKIVYVTLKEAQSFLEYGRKIDSIEIKVSDIYETGDMISRISAEPAFRNLSVRDWPMLNKNLFSALKLEKIAMFVILSFIILVAALNIVTTITRSVLDKKRAISILKAMGANQTQMLLIFLLQGILIGLTGTLLGLVGGWSICYYLNHFELIKLPDIYYNTTVPVQMVTEQFVMIGLTAFLITGICALYPAWRASRLDPLEGIRY